MNARQDPCSGVRLWTSNESPMRTDLINKKRKIKIEKKKMRNQNERRRRKKRKSKIQEEKSASRML